MKKRFFVVIFLALTLFLPRIAFGDFQSELNTQTGAFAGNQGARFADPQDPRIVVASLIRLALTLVGTLFLAYAVYAGYIILTSAGNEDQIEKGTSTLKTATIGIIIALSSYAIVTFVSRSLLEAGEEPQPGWQI